MLKFGGTSGNLKEIKTWLKGDIDYGEVSNRKTMKESRKVGCLCPERFRSDSTSGFCSLKKAWEAKLDYNSVMDEEKAVAVLGTWWNLLTV